LFVGVSEVTFCKEEDVVWFVNADGPPGNYVIHTQIQSHAIDTRIEEIISQISQYTDHIDWPVFRRCYPPNLTQHLEAFGLTAGSVLWMLAKLTDLPDVSLPAEDFRVALVTNETMLDDWKHISRAGFEMDPSGAQTYYDAYARHGFGAEAISLHYIGYQNDEPVTSSTLLLAGGIAGIYDISTPPRLRRNGFGTAITLATLREAQNRGYNWACLMSSAMGERIYRKLGFSIRVNVPEYRWKKKG
jgi:GNAT superfamily N-acetyltransferase